VISFLKKVFNPADISTLQRMHEILPGRKSAGGGAQSCSEGVYFGTGISNVIIWTVMRLTGRGGFRESIDHPWQKCEIWGSLIIEEKSEE
jgi:hypothetical protein